MKPIATRSRTLVRDAITVLFVFFTFPLWGLVRLCAPSGREISLFVTFGQMLSLLPGSLGYWFRRAYYLMTLSDCHRDLGIGFSSYFTKRKVAIEPRVSIGAGCMLGSCRLGEGTLLGSNIDVLSGRHQHPTSTKLRAGEPQQYTQVIIGRNVWIGNRTIVMADIGDHGVIGAGSVVVKAIPAECVAVGNPCVVKKSMSTVPQPQTPRE